MHRMALIAMLSLSAAALAEPEPLQVGDPAPPLERRVDWVQGGPINAFEAGEVYVLDFWAPWCGPCLQTLPLLSDLGRRHQGDGLTVIAVAVWPSPDMTPVREFVAERGEQMWHPVAEDIDDRVAESYLDALGENGIPTSVVVDQQGRVAWVGHPAGGLEEAARQILAGEYDIEAAAKKHEAQGEAQRLAARAEDFAEQGDWDQAFELIDEAVALAPDQFARLALVKFQYMVGRFGDVEEGYAYGRALIDGPLADKPFLLENMARFIVEVPGLEPRDLDMAARALELAAELTGGKEPVVLETKAAVCAAKEDFENAVALQREAIALTDPDSPMLERLQHTLDRYAAALEAGR